MQRFSSTAPAQSVVLLLSRVYACDMISETFKTSPRRCPQTITLAVFPGEHKSDLTGILRGAVDGQLQLLRYSPTRHRLCHSDQTCASCFPARTAYICSYVVRYTLLAVLAFFCVYFRIDLHMCSGPVPKRIRWMPHAHVQSTDGNTERKELLKGTPVSVSGCLFSLPFVSFCSDHT